MYSRASKTVPSRNDLSIFIILQSSVKPLFLLLRLLTTQNVMARKVAVEIRLEMHLRRLSLQVRYLVILKVG